MVLRPVTVAEGFVADCTLVGTAGLLQDEVGRVGSVGQTTVISSENEKKKANGEKMY